MPACSSNHNAKLGFKPGTRIQNSKFKTVNKSDIANNFLAACHDGNRQISSFLSKEDQLSGVNANFTGGTLEATWFLPYKESAMEEMTCVLNLRGSAHQYKAQSQLILQGASVSVILFDNEEQLTGDFDKNSLNQWLPT